ncbi:MAG: two-component system response regulator, partial [Elainellaceae cyanobacterium]
MKNFQDYVLVLEQQSEDAHSLKLLLEPLRCPLVIASSPEQAIARLNHSTPYLVILIGNHQSWPPALVAQLRQAADAVGSTIVALTDYHAPNWPSQEENRLFDGFLVKPLDEEVLTSLIQAARARHAFWAMP